MKKATEVVLQEKNIRHFFRSLFFKIPAALTVLIILMMVVSILSTYQIVHTNFKIILEKKSYSFLASLNWSIYPLYTKADYQQIHRTLQSASMFPLVKKLRLYDTNGKILSSSVMGENGKSLSEDTVQDILHSGNIKAIETDDSSTYYKLAIPVWDALAVRSDMSRTGACLYMEVNLESEKRGSAFFFNALIIQNIIIILAMAVFLSLALNRTILKPLKDFMKATTELFLGNYDYRIVHHYRDEFGQFARLFNAMADKISSQNSVLHSYSVELEEKVQERTQVLENTNQELSRAYEKLKNARSELLQAEKMASIGQLAAGVAHEINNPISYMKSNMNTMKKYQTALEAFFQEIKGMGGLDAIREKYKIDRIKADTELIIGDVLAGCERIEAIVRNLKSFSYHDQQDMVSADLKQLIERTLPMSDKPSPTTEIKLELKEVPPVLCQPHQISQIFMNLFNNAVQAMDRPGAIRVRTYYRSGRVFLVIEDQGCGIPEINLNRVFNPFFTTKEIGKGTGLGLYIVYELIKIHHGKIRVRSTIGKGTRVTVIFPANQQTEIK